MIGFRGRVVTLSLVIVILAAVYVVVTVFAGQATGANVSHRPLLASLQASHVAEVRLSVGGKSQVVLAKRGNGWVVIVGKNALPASSVRVESFLSSLSDLRKGKLVGTKPIYFSDFGLESKEAGRIMITSAGGRTLADILVGKPGTSGYEDYLRLAGEPRVFLTKSSLNFYLSQGRSYWYRLFVFPDEVKASNIAAITVEGDLPLNTGGSAWSRESYRLVRDKGTAPSHWSLVGKRVPLEQAKVNSILNNVASLHGVDFLLDTSQAHTTNRSFEIDVTTTDGKQWRMTARELAGGETLLVTVSGSREDYIVNTAAVRRAIVPFHDLSISN